MRICLPTCVEDEARADATDQRMWEEDRDLYVVDILHTIGVAPLSSRANITQWDFVKTTRQHAAELVFPRDGTELAE